ncbi:S8 family peptidase [Nocardioides speluncae]|uniref:S8 family peptidase n=1 Tax=Nocardioides speluncae TaxID=2670337 RepID=UPI000D68CE91|nr:S8 family serine peptidase [Nocardioides speluncae]
MKTTARVTLVAVTAAALATSSLRASAEPNAPASAPQGAGAADNVSTVTLLTGDRVTVTKPFRGEPTYVVAPAPGADRDGVTFEVSSVDGATYIMPSDVAALTGADGVLDTELFNVTRLIAEGFDDRHADSLPLIVQRADGKEPTAIDGLSSEEPVDVLRAHSGELDKDATAVLGEELGDAGTVPVTPRDRGEVSEGTVVPDTQLDSRAGDLAGVSRIWLNGSTKAAAWDANLTQVGAPTAWDGGVTGVGVKVAVLDTGIDSDHPDLVGQVAATANFSRSPSMTDVKGHGTHVAGTIAGTGALAPGVRRGVAPGATLLIGKVLGDDGFGDLAASVRGMEWAVENGARVVNMSLGSAPTDGTDPVSLALNELSASSGALFVVAAGNTGPGANTVSAPSTADAALSVAAVDATGTVAGFSSRGPRIGDDGFKPEIAAPGVSITAPRSSDMPGAPGDYATFSGTSMATPHVAGVAAMLAQEHPNWTGQQIKSALMATAAPAAGGPAAVGAGQVFAPDALATAVVPSTGNVHVNLGDDDTAVTREVAYTNTGTADTTVRLGVSGNPSTTLTVTPVELALAPGETGTVSVTVDGTAVDPAAPFSGAVIATPGQGPVLRTPVTATRARWVTATALTTTGAPAPGTFVTVLNHDDGTFASGRTDAQGRLRIAVHPGRLAVTGTIQEPAENGSISSLVTTDVPAGETEARLDAAATVPAGAEVPLNTREEMALILLMRINDTTRTATSNGLIAGGAYGQIQPGRLRISPTPDSPTGSVRLDEHWILANADSDNRVGDATTLYDLVFDRRTVPADPVHRLDAGDVKRLARVDADLHAPAQEHRGQFATTAIGEQIIGLNVTTPSYVQLPRAQKRFVTADGVLWTQLAFANFTVARGSLSMDLRPIRREYAAGGRYTESFWGGPLGAAAAAGITRRGTATTLTAAFEDMVDSAGQIGRYAEFTFPQRGSSRTTIYRDGVALSGRTNVLVDGAPARYRLERTYDGQDVFPLGGQVTTAWGTEPVGAAAGDGTVGLPLAQLLWNGIDLDLANRASAGVETAVEVRATSSALNPADRTFAAATASWTTDGGASWTPVGAHARGAGVFRFSVPGEALTSGAWVGLRFETADAAGNTVRQTLLRAIPVA